jgi:hypothetical protein
MSLTLKRLKEVLNYREDGNFLWKISAGCIKIGDIAGSSPNDNDYISTKIDGKGYYNHRLVWFWHYGYFPEGIVEHIDRVKYHNWVSNLREASKSCNMRNTGNTAANTSGVKGVCWIEQSNKWRVGICANKIGYSLGLFEDFDEAVCARLAAEQCLDWSNCDSNSPAYQYVQKIILK